MVYSTRGAGSLVINLQNDSTTFMSGEDIEYDIRAAEYAVKTKLSWTSCVV